MEEPIAFCNRKPNAAEKPVTDAALHFICALNEFVPPEFHMDVLLSALLTLSIQKGTKPVELRVMLNGATAFYEDSYRRIEAIQQGGGSA